MTKVDRAAQAQKDGLGDLCNTNNAQRIPGTEYSNGCRNSLLGPTNA